MDGRLADIAWNSSSDEQSLQEHHHQHHQGQQPHRPVPHDGGTFKSVADRLKGHVEVILQEADLIETTVDNIIRDPTLAEIREAAKRLRLTGRFMGFELDRLIHFHNRLEQQSQDAAPGSAVETATAALAAATLVGDAAAAASGGGAAVGSSSSSGSVGPNDNDADVSGSSSSSSSSSGSGSASA
ncbi:hypothetical protein VTH06DRAFT_236 [Thermothelomyces fergusii]